MDELLEQFLIESRELIAQANENLEVLERAPNDAARIDAAFRAVHTLKGSVAIFDMAPVGAVLHAAEDVLSQARAGRSRLDRAAITILQDCVDQTDRWIDSVERDGVLPADASRVAAGLVTSISRASASVDADPEPAGPADWVIDLMRDRPAGIAQAEKPLIAFRYRPDPDCFFRGDDPLAIVAAMPGLVMLDLGAQAPWPPVEAFAPFCCNLLIRGYSDGTRADVEAAFRFVADQVDFADLSAVRRREEPTAAVPALSERDGTTRTLRVDAARIDALVDSLGELIVAKNGLSYHAAQAESGTVAPSDLAAAIRATQADIERLVADMHRAVMAVRLIPVEQTFRRLPRIARELAASTGRDIAFTMTGGETEIDKSVAEGLFEPLLHLLRNAVDHGVEAPAARLAAGKAARGSITLGARRSGDQVIVELADDGGGIDPAAMRRRAADRGILSLAAAETMTDDAAIDLIFAPGFSTAEKITDISGRGVGMDAARTTIERLSGRVGVGSAIGKGTTIRLVLPLTAVMTRVLIVRIGTERFGVAIDRIRETTSIPRDIIRPAGSGRAFVLRDRTVPVLDLADLLGLDRASLPDMVKLLVVDVGADVIAVMVDGFGERLDVMLRPMTGLLAGLPGVSGTTLMGDGSVLLVLDMMELVG